MRLFALRVAFTALAALAAAQTTGPNAFENPPGGYQFTPGESTDLTWSNQKGSTVTLTLRQGSNGNLDPGTVIQGMFSSPFLGWWCSARPPLRDRARPIFARCLADSARAQPMSPTRASTPGTCRPTCPPAAPTPSKSRTMRTRTSSTTRRSSPCRTPTRRPRRPRPRRPPPARRRRRRRRRRRPAT